MKHLQSSHRQAKANAELLVGMLSAATGLTVSLDRQPRLSAILQGDRRWWPFSVRTAHNLVRVEVPGTQIDFNSAAGDRVYVGEHSHTPVGAYRRILEVIDVDHACAVCGVVERPSLELHQTGDHWYCEPHCPDCGKDTAA